MAPEQLEGSHSVDHRADILLSRGRDLRDVDGRASDRTFSRPVGQSADRCATGRGCFTDARERTETPLPARRRYQDGCCLYHPPTEPLRRSRLPNTQRTEPREEPASSLRGNLENQELTARLLVLRRQLMGPSRCVATSVVSRDRSFRCCLASCSSDLAFACWAPNQDVPHRLVSGVMLHVYGVLMIICAGITCGKIKSVDYTKRWQRVWQRYGTSSMRYVDTTCAPGPGSDSLGGSCGSLYASPSVSKPSPSIPLRSTRSIAIGVLGFVVSLFLYQRYVISGSKEVRTLVQSSRWEQPCQCVPGIWRRFRPVENA